MQNSFLNELEHFIPLLKIQCKGYFSNRGKNDDKEQDKLLCPFKVLNWIVDDNMIDVFPNVQIAYRLFVTLPRAKCESERSFLVLKRIKNYIRSTMLNEHLINVSRLTIECELFRQIDFTDIIQSFAEEKSRTKNVTI